MEWTTDKVHVYRFIDRRQYNDIHTKVTQSDMDDELSDLLTNLKKK